MAVRSVARKTSTSARPNLGAAAARAATGGVKPAGGSSSAARGASSIASVQHTMAPPVPDDPLEVVGGPAAPPLPPPSSGISPQGQGQGQAQGAPSPGMPPGGGFAYSAPTAPPGSDLPQGFPGPPGGGDWSNFVAPPGYQGPGAFNVSPPQQDPNNPGMATSGVPYDRAMANYTPPAPSPPGFAPDGRPWWMVIQDSQAKAANPYTQTYPGSGYLNNGVWTSITDYGTPASGPAYQPPAQQTPQQGHQAMMQAYGYALSPEERTRQQMIQMWGPQGRGW